MIKRPLFLMFCLTSLLCACASQRQTDLAAVDTTNLNQLTSVEVQPILAKEQSSGLSNLRANSLKDTAMGLGAQGALAWAAEGLNGWLNKNRAMLDTAFNFNGMVLSHGVMPPVLAQGDNTLNLNDPSTIRVADRTYKIIKPARFATTPPNWREYLLLNFDKPSLPDKSLLPKSADEQQIWRNAVRLGWERGIQQAYSIFNQNVARLKQDYLGMALYRKLLQHHMISAPFVARTELGITGDGNDMRINDQVLRIVEQPQLQTSGKRWKAVIAQGHQ